MMRAFPRFQVFDRFVFHLEPMQFHDSKILLSRFPDLTLLQLHLATNLRANRFGEKCEQKIGANFGVTQFGRIDAVASNPVR